MNLGLGARGPWLGLVAGVLALGAIEVVVLHLLVGVLLPAGLALAVDVVVGGLTAALLVAVASPLWSRHRVQDGVARLRLGWVAAVDVPLDAVTAARVHMPRPTAPPELGAGFDEASGRLELVRAPSSPLALVELARPTPARVQLFRRVETTSVVVGTDDAEALARALRGGNWPRT